MGPGIISQRNRRIAQSDRSTAVSSPVGNGLRIAAAATAVDGLGCAGYGVWQLIGIATRPRGTALVVAVLGGLLFVLFGAGLVGVARALWNGRRRGRAPAVVAHLLALLLVPGLLEGGTWWLAAALAVLAVAAGVGVFVPASTATFTARR
jgi:hypothetical protein